MQTETQAQLGFCSGNSGDPIFTESFGTGATTELALGTTSYSYSSGQPNDGYYNVSSNTNWFGWFDIDDHTPNDSNGRMLIINADFTAGEFYQTTISGLCENTTYEFSSWMVNLSPASDCGGAPIPINIKFEIWDNTNTNILASGDTGNIHGTSSPIWQQYALVFQSLPGQTSVILKMLNNGVGGCGNDVAIDDIVFKSCGDAITTEDSGNNSSISICNNQTYSGTIAAIPDGSVFGTKLFYQWQESIDGMTWSDMTGDTNQNLTVSNITAPMTYRAKVAEDIINIDNPQCNTFSDVFQISVAPDPFPPVSDGDVDFNCSTGQAILAATVPGGFNINWYDSATGGTLLATNSSTYLATSVGFYYAETEDNATGCVSISRTAISATIINPVAPISNGDADFNCANNEVILTVTVPTGISVNWYDSITGGKLLQANSVSYSAATWGIFYAESVINTTGCISTIRTPVNSLITYPAAPISNGDVNESCIGTPESISVTVPSGIIANWYDVASGGMPLLSGSTTFTPISPGTYYADAEIISTGCQSTLRTAIQVNFVETPQVEDEYLNVCSGASMELSANVINTGSINADFLWNTGETSESIMVNTAGTYTVEVTNNGFCPVIKTIELTQAEDPSIDSVKSDGEDIVITTTNTGDFLYSIDGSVFQSSNRFRDVEGGLYSVYVKSQDCPELVSTEYLHFYIPKYFTPNNDGHNDLFNLSGIEYYASSSVSIFDRYGKLLKNSRNSRFSWDGTFNGVPLTSSDYWYVVIIDNQKFTGHVTLKR